MKPTGFQFAKCPNPNSLFLRQSARCPFSAFCFSQAAPFGFGVSRPSSQLDLQKFAFFQRPAEPVQEGLLGSWIKRISAEPDSCDDGNNKNN